MAEKNESAAAAFAEAAPVKDKPGVESKSGSYLSQWGEHRFQDWYTHGDDICAPMSQEKSKPAPGISPPMGKLFQFSPE